MLKVICLKTCKIYDSFFDDYKIDIQEDNLYYAHLDKNLRGRTEVYYIYNFETADYIGIYPIEYFGPYELFVAKQRDKKIEEILKD